MSCKVIFWLTVVVTGSRPFTLTTKSRIYVRPTTATDAVSVGDAQRTRQSTVAPSADASLWRCSLLFLFCLQSLGSFCLSLGEEGIWFVFLLQTTLVQQYRQVKWRALQSRARGSVESPPKRSIIACRHKIPLLVSTIFFYRHSFLCHKDGAVVVVVPCGCQFCILVRLVMYRFLLLLSVAVLRGNI